MFDVQTTVLSRVDWRRTNEKVETFRAENEQTFKRLFFLICRSFYALNLGHLMFLCIVFGTQNVLELVAILREKMSRTRRNTIFQAFVFERIEFENLQSTRASRQFLTKRIQSLFS